MTSIQKFFLAVMIGVISVWLLDGRGIHYDSLNWTVFAGLVIVTIWSVRLGYWRK